MAVLALLPGMPMLPFLVLAGAAGAIAYRTGRAQSRAAAALAAKEAVRVAAEDAPPAPGDEPIATALAIDPLKIELGYALLPLINAPDGQDRLSEQIKALRRQLATELGFVMPSVRLLDNMQLEANAYLVRVKEVEAGRGVVHPGHFMVMDPEGKPIGLPGIHTREPTFGLPATWVDFSLREEASIRGFTVVDPSTVMATHLTEVIKANVADLLTYADVQKLLKDLPKDQQKLVEDLVPSQISVSGIQRVLQALLAERVSIRDLSTILEGVADAVSMTRNVEGIVEHVRARLARQICAANQAPGGYLPLVSLGPKWEQAFAEAMVGTGEERRLAIAPSKLQDFVGAVRDAFEDAAAMGEMPVLLTSPALRPHVRAIVERFRPQTAVLSQAEVHPRAKLKTIAAV